MEPVRVTFEPAGVTVEVAPGTTLLEAGRKAGVGLDAPCGGIGRCGACHVRATGALAPATHDELELLGGASIAAGKRLACRARATGAVTVTTRAGRGAARVVTHGVAAEAVVEPPAERGIARRDGSPYLLGAVADIGTTTVAVALIDLESGDELASAGMLNAQYPWGADVMTRISSAVAEGVATLQRTIVRQVERLITGMLSPLAAGEGDVREIAVVGNTAMTNAFLGADLAPLATAPYEGARLAASSVPAAELGMAALTSAVCHVLPGASAFVGADAVAGVLATRLDRRVLPVVYLDLGTNGEIVLAARGRLTATSAAAGPALEGAGITSGMRAEPGAIERVWLENGDVMFATVGGFPPVGICGSGALDLIAVLLEAGLLDAGGRLPDAGSGGMASRITERDGVRVFVVDGASGVVLTQHDVRQLQLAKGAVRVALELLLERASITPGEVDEVLVAGGFGLHVDGATLARIGMIPPEWSGRLTFLGNAAKEGARVALLSSAARREAGRIAEAVRTLPLAEDPDFQQRFIGALGFPDGGTAPPASK